MPPTGLERLWSPWRMAYIRSARVTARRPPTSTRGCLFCRVRRGAADRADLVLVRRAHAFLMLNRFPYNPGHLMVAVARHAPRFESLTPAERADVFDLTALAEGVLAAEYAPDGMNYGANVGAVAGAGFPGHLHLHLVPRWNGDTNFMPAIGETKVLPESLTRTWTRLRRAIAAAGGTRRPAPGRKERGRGPGRR